MATHRATLRPRTSARAVARVVKKPAASAAARRSPTETVCCAASRSRQGQSVNHDAFQVERGAMRWIAVADGGAEAGAAKRALHSLGEQVASQAAPTLAAGCALAALRGARAVGFCAPGLRAAVVSSAGGECRWLSDGGDAVGFDEALRPGEACLLFTDGAWRALGPGWEVALAATGNVWSWPATLLDWASRDGRSDDMTVAVLRRG